MRKSPLLTDLEANTNALLGQIAVLEGLIESSNAATITRMKDSEERSARQMARLRALVIRGLNLSDDTVAAAVTGEFGGNADDANASDLQVNFGKCAKSRAGLSAPYSS